MLVGVDSDGEHRVRQLKKAPEEGSWCVGRVAGAQCHSPCLVVRLEAALNAAKMKIGI